ncbi:dihydrolipoamide acetyltransferase family protein [Hydrogenophaga sp. PBL-H3]|uniref:dihydrolipoamide acetyltransferase family protein n=1 Tax=Hydrogenophaga sp. PBL-H3 TaxID=434010 RepID=UPI00131F5D93|nr:dihydrolipoamide acetyltransferase family protein [Hydrogenophaga sp. PBL-H3]QHE76160.1 2-oxo acid dehydrogenase subunit E2 [Hydrogenophaga sp. PBL-H3]QHE80584.1 2-oxo acid dehydrogenase subunit E2 [Hydrogenophaga sp. PBL-H3]
MIELRMPSFGADMDAARFVQWQVKPGQALKRGDVVAVVETQKGAIDVELWQDGTMARLIAQPGQQIPVGDVLAVLAGEGEDWQALAAAPPATPPQPAAGQRSRVSPAARQRAQALGVNIEALAAQLGEQVVTLADVERAAAGTPAASTATPATMPPSRAEAMRSAIGAAMVRSWHEIPHYHVGCEIVVEAPLRALEAFNRDRPVNERVLFAAVLLRAVAQAVAETPTLNGRFEGGHFQPAEAVHLGVVTSLRGGGLVVPTVHDAQRLSLPELMAALRAVLERARSGQLRSSDLADSTLSVSHLGELGAESVMGVIYPPQVALVGLGRVVLRPAVVDGQVVAARTLRATLSGDHRVSDGLVGSRFLAALTARLASTEPAP